MLTRALLAGILALLALAGTAGAEPVPEGAVVPFNGPTNLSWTLPAGEYFLQVAYGMEGALLNVSDMREHLREEGSSHSGGFGKTVTFSEGQTRTIAVLRGTGAATITRKDIDVGYYGEPWNRTASGLLSPGGCRAYIYNVPHGTLPLLVNATGDRATFTVYSNELKPVSSSDGRLTFLVDRDDGTLTSLVIQACDKTNENATFALQVLNPAPGATRPLHLTPLPSGWAPLLATALAVALRKRR